MTILSNEADRKKLKGMIIEITNCLTRMDAEKELIKEIAENAEGTFQIKAKYIRKMAATLHKHNYADVQKETEQFEYLYESVVEEASNED